MHVVDVNSGPKMQKKDQEMASFSVNLESAEEIARQLRLRDIGGLIIIDFIDMRNGEHKQSLYKKMKDFMRNDRAQHTILPLSKFGLMQYLITNGNKSKLTLNVHEFLASHIKKGFPSLRMKWYQKYKH